MISGLISRPVVFAAMVLLAGTALLSAQHLVSPAAAAPPAPGNLADASEALFATAAPSGGVPFSYTAPSQLDKHEQRKNALWIASLLTVVGATSADALSSWHKHESNSLLASSDGTFGGKGVGIKVGLAATMVVPQLLLRKHKDLRGPFTIGNFLDAGIFTGAVIHNQTLSAAK